MIVSTILLSQDDEYVDKDGNLPARPVFDKFMLRELCRGKAISGAAEAMLPPSIRNVTGGIEFMPITIKEIDKYAELLIVVRSKSQSLGGKVFRFTNFKMLARSEGIELWIRKEKKN